jgi:hypothetical protein
MHAQVPGDVCCCTVCGQWWSYDAYRVQGASLQPPFGPGGSIHQTWAAQLAREPMSHDDVLEAFTAAERRMTLER